MFNNTQITTANNSKTASSQVLKAVLDGFQFVNVPFTKGKNNIAVLPTITDKHSVFTSTMINKNLDVLVDGYNLQIKNLNVACLVQALTGVKLPVYLPQGSNKPVIILTSQALNDLQSEDLASIMNLLSMIGLTMPFSIDSIKFEQAIIKMAIDHEYETLKLIYLAIIKAQSIAYEYGINASHFLAVSSNSSNAGSKYQGLITLMIKAIIKGIETIDNTSVKTDINVKVENKKQAKK